MDTKTAVAEKTKTLRETEDLLRTPAPAPLVRRCRSRCWSRKPASRRPPSASGPPAPDGRTHGLGQTKYIDDFYLPGMLYAKIKRAGVASALIKSIDTSEAEAMPGVVAVLTGKEIPGQLVRARR